MPSQFGSSRRVWNGTDHLWVSGSVQDPRVHPWQQSTAGIVHPQESGTGVHHPGGGCRKTAHSSPFHSTSFHSDPQGCSCRTQSQGKQSKTKRVRNNSNDLRVFQYEVQKKQVTFNFAIKRAFFSPIMELLRCPRGTLIFVHSTCPCS